MPLPPDVRVYETTQQAAEALAAEVSRLSAAAIAERGRFTIALSGGSTPAALYALLAAPPHADGIDWPRWHVFWGDERCVPASHPDSNYGMARRTLLDRVPIPPQQVHRMAGEDDPRRAANAYAAVLAETLDPDGRLDLALLGVGDDGHTASLFPNTAALTETERSVSANWVPHLNAHRITLTLPTLSRARHVTVLATGADKADAVRRALAPR
ncbi:MAG: 6-phosphogluconolactonase, partial [Chloroflexota bacterium]|nr:6-phosphogluconolactonase [Chloroflexota bacterium]